MAVKKTETSTEKKTTAKKTGAFTTVSAANETKKTAPKKKTVAKTSTKKDETAPAQTVKKTSRSAQPAKRKRRASKKKSARLIPVLAGGIVGGIFMFLMMVFVIPFTKDLVETFSAGKAARLEKNLQTENEPVAVNENKPQVKEQTRKEPQTQQSHVAQQQQTQEKSQLQAQPQVAQQSKSQSQTRAAPPQSQVETQVTQQQVAQPQVRPVTQAAVQKTASQPQSQGTAQQSQPQVQQMQAKPQVRLQTAVSQTQTAALQKQSTQTAAPQTQQSAAPQIASAKPDKIQQPSTQKNNESALAETIPLAVRGAKLVFVFDDGGQNMSQLESFVTLPFPITVAVLPRLAHSVDAAKRIRASGNELMLHQPMQAINIKVNPGPGAILPEMSADEIKATVKANIAEIAPVAGVNNHEGSLISEDEFKMMAVLETIKANGIFYLDSRTTSQTRVPQAAMELGMGYYARNIFLDNTKKREDILTEIRKGLDVANKTGCAIMIGHIWSSDVLPGILRELYPILTSKGYTFSTVGKSGAMIRQ